MIEEKKRSENDFKRNFKKILPIVNFFVRMPKLSEKI